MVMNKLLQLHDKVKYHRYRDDIILNASRCRSYTDAFTNLLDAFQKEINMAKQTAIPLPSRPTEIPPSEPDRAGVI